MAEEAGRRQGEGAGKEGGRVQRVCYHKQESALKDTLQATRKENVPNSAKRALAREGEISGWGKFPGNVATTWSLV